jgi:hypothetical protein
MEIGLPQRVIVVEPLEMPEPLREATPAPTPERQPEPIQVPA